MNIQPRKAYQQEFFVVSMSHYEEKVLTSIQKKKQFQQIFNTKIYKMAIKHFLMSAVTRIAVAASPIKRTQVHGQFTKHQSAHFTCFFVYQLQQFSSSTAHTIRRSSYNYDAINWRYFYVRRRRLSHSVGHVTRPPWLLFPCWGGFMHYNIPSVSFHILG